MQTAISWANYLTGVLIVTAGYYIFVGYKFYRKEIASLLSGRRIRFRGLEPASADRGAAKNSHNNTAPAETNVSMQGLYDELEEVVQDLKTTILEKAGGKSKPDLLALLSGRLENYAGLRRPAFRVAVNHFIINQTEQTCGIVFDEAELNQAWDALNAS